MISHDPHALSEYTFQYIFEKPLHYLLAKYDVDFSKVKRAVNDVKFLQLQIISKH